MSVESPQTPTRDFRQEVTDQIIAMLEKGTAPWQKPWEAGALQLPFNPTTDRTYRGGNALHLMAAGARNGYDDPRWLTYRQAQEKGWQVRQGEKGSQIEFWQFGDGQGNANQPPSESRTPEPSQQAPVRRVYTVFNARQIEGITAYTPQRPQEWEIADAGEQILRNSGANIAYDQNDRAFYDPRRDSIHLPPKEAFKSAPDFYGTALHELSHWSGHPTRLNRATLTGGYRFGDPAYAREELRAELASVFLAAERGIPHSPDQHAAYVASWIKALRDDKNEIFRAARDAHRAADYILELEHAKSVESPQLRHETSEHVADFERGSGTVDITEKETAIEHREPATVSSGAGEPERDETGKADAEKILDGEVDGRRPPSERDFEKSLAAAEAAAKDALGDRARVYQPDTESGKYRGTIIAGTDHHVVQQLSPMSAVAHPKNLLPDVLNAGQSVTVSYDNNIATLKPYKARERSAALAR